ncbi:MAG: PmoA family protein [bacterium]
MFPMFRCIVVLLAATSLIAVNIAWTDSPRTVTADLQADGVHVTVDGKLFTVYLTGETQKYPYFYPVNGPASGRSVTTESAEPYPHHHSLFFGCDHVNGGNYWQEEDSRGQIVSRNVEMIEAEGPQVVFADSCEWVRPDAPSPFRDERTITISAPCSDTRLIDFDITLIALMDVHITKTNHSLFSARMVPELCVKQGGTLINAHGDTKEEGTFGKESPWCDYWGVRNGITEGLAIFAYPQNKWFPPQWFTRDYGFFSPAPMFWLDEKEGLKMATDERLRLRFRCVVHKGNTQEAKIADLFQDWEIESKDGETTR